MCRFYNNRRYTHNASTSVMPGMGRERKLPASRRRAEIRSYLIAATASKLCFSLHDIFQEFQSFYCKGHHVLRPVCPMPRVELPRIHITFHSDSQGDIASAKGSDECSLVHGQHSLLTVYDSWLFHLSALLSHSQKSCTWILDCCLCARPSLQRPRVLGLCIYQDLPVSNPQTLFEIRVCRAISC